MTALPPSDPQSLITLDLSGDPETPAAAAGRIIGGLLTMIIGGVLAIGLFAASMLGWLVPAIADWVDLLGDVLLYGAAIAAGIAITGFTIMRRGRKVRAQEAAEAAALVASVKTATAEQPSPGTPGGPSATGSETHL